MKTNIQRDKKKQWSLEENTLLKQLYPTYSSKKWKKLAQTFKLKGYNRSQLEIRERWTNFVDPSLLFTEWTLQELQTLYVNYNKYGSKWCFIKKTLPGRTENKIKNKFYGNIRILLRFVVNYFNRTKQDTMWIHKINPSILNDIYKGSEEFQQFGNEIQIVISQMGYNVDKIRLLSKIERKQEQYKKLYEKIILLQDKASNKKQRTPQQRQVGNSINQIQDPSHSSNNQDEGRRSNEQQLSSKIKIPQVTFQRKNQNFIFQQNQNYLFSQYNSEFDYYNYPLLQLQSGYPFFNCWFYNN